MKIVVYAICKNEAGYAERWMASMAEADGVYVLDTGSTDGTAERLRALGAVVVEERVEPWRFDTARNRWWGLVREDADIWVWTELDEVLHPGWRAGLEAAWTDGTTQAVYRYTWNFNADGSEGTVFWIEKIHARRGSRWTHPVHEVLDRPAGWGPGRKCPAEGGPWGPHAHPPHSRGPRRSPAGTAAGSGGKGAAAEGVSFAACGEAKDLELAATLSRCAPSATGNCSLLRRKYRWTASSLFFGLRSSLLPCSRALHASILPHFRAKRKRGDSPRSFRAIYFASAVASTLPNSWPL